MSVSLNDILRKYNIKESDIIEKKDDYVVTNKGDCIVLDGVKFIDMWKFKDCKNLKSVTIPASVQRIYRRAFEGCSSLETVNYNAVDCSYWGGNMGPYDGGAYEHPFKECVSLTTVNIGKGVKKIPDYAFYSKSITKVTISDSVTSIGWEAFAYCSYLTSVIIPNSVTIIGNRAFEGCRSLTSIEIPDSVSILREEAFHNCTSLKDVTISNSVTSIKERVFWNCLSLTSIKIPDSVTTIEYQAFRDCKNLETVIIPNSVKSIGGYAFVNCRSLESITIPNSITSIGDCAFGDCVNLTSIVIPDSVKAITSKTFAGCINLESIVIPNSVIKIGELAFLNCTSLNSIRIPVSVKYIGADAFKGCTELKDIFYSGSKKEWNKIEYFYNIPNYVKIHFECDNEENKEEVINNSDIEKEVIRLLSKGVSEKGILSTLQSKGFKDKDIVNSISNINPSSSMVSSFCDKVILPKVIDLLNQTSQGVSKYSVGEVARLLYKNYPENLVNKTIVSILDEQHLVD